MRFIHTGDWHLGRAFYNASLIEDQVYVLDQLVACVRERKPDLVLVAGDIYDRPVPPTDAVALLDETLSRLILGEGVPVILIAGNHDSPQRLQFGARLMESLRLYVHGTLSNPVTSVQMDDGAGPVCFYALPYAEPPVIRERLSDDHINDYDTAFRAWVKLVQATHPRQARAVLVTHAFVLGGEVSDSERPLSVGGSSAVGGDIFHDFDYVALGHLHRPQTIAGAPIHYAGSLLKYSFSEATHNKSINWVEMDAKGHCEIERIPLTPKRDVRRVEGHLDDLLNAPSPANRNDFIQFKLLDKRAILDVMGKLREAYPNAMDIDRSQYIEQARLEIRQPNLRQADVLSLFSDFFSQATGEMLTEEERNTFTVIVDRIRRQDREGDE
jgi:DNA repair protein SbcD/Mre11